MKDKSKFNDRVMRALARLEKTFADDGGVILMVYPANGTTPKIVASLKKPDKRSLYHFSRMMKGAVLRTHEAMLVGIRAVRRQRAKERGRG